MYLYSVSTPHKSAFLGLCERRAHSGLESEENFGGDSDETPEHFGGLLAELSLRHGKQRTHLGKTSRLEMATKKFV